MADDREYISNGKEIEKIHTPNVHTIEELVGFLNTTADAFAKTLIYKADGKLVAVMVRGDREVNEVKLQNLLGASELELADAESVKAVTHAEVGFAGPVGLEIDVYADREVEKMRSFVVGANETDYHLVNVEIGRDFTPKAVADLRIAADGDKCPRCGAQIKTIYGIEVGHIFKLGTKYSKALGLTFPDKDGTEQPVIMGCYGIGVNRCLAAAIEQNNDQNGIVWPLSLAPYHVVVVPANTSDETQMALAEKIYGELQKKGVETLIDDRDERPGVKFKDSELIGIPIRITVGKKAGENIVEFKKRTDASFSEVSSEEAIEKALQIVKKEF